MSEYQYYEFQTIDRPLTSDQMSELRSFSTRATITPSRFMNVYNWGDLKGDPRQWMERYFDAFVYEANWGTHWFMLRFPRRVLPPETVQRYCVPHGLTVHVKGEYAILEFLSENEEGGEWIEEEDSEAWLPTLIPLRADLAGGDLRSLYLGWLACVRAGMLEDDEIEPPVPPGLGRLSVPLTALASFLRIDKDLIEVAAERSTDLEVEWSSSDLDRWVRDLPAAEKDDLLLRLAKGDAPHLRADLLMRFREAHPVEWKSDAARRTVAELLAAAEERTEARRREEAARKAQEQAHRQREQAAARAAYLDDLAKKDEAVWHQVESLIDPKRPKGYEEAVRLLVDLRDVAALKHEIEAYKVRLNALRAQHAKRPSFIERLNRAGLPRG